jgi:hypothetical protein
LIAFLLSVIASLLAGIILIAWRPLKKYIPFVKKPFIRVSYQSCGKHFVIMIENRGNAPAQFFTADITSKRGLFSKMGIDAPFELLAPGEGGSWTVISARNILPQQLGAVEFQAEGAVLELNPPKMESDSRTKFVGHITSIWGPEETIGEEEKN